MCGKNEADVKLRLYTQLDTIVPKASFPPNLVCPIQLSKMDYFDQGIVNKLHQQLYKCYYYY